MTTGRFAPSPSGSLHLGNLRTALLAWCFARKNYGRFLLRMEDLTTGAVPIAEREQIDDLTLLGLDFDGPVLRQSERSCHYEEALRRLSELGLTYPCFCSRREIREASAAPHGGAPEGAYPGICASLSPSESRRRVESGQRAATRLRAGSPVIGFVDGRVGGYERVVDDFVLCRADGVAAYNLAVVVDDAESGVDQVVRGDDLLDSTPRQVLLQRLLGLATPDYFHVPLVLAPDGSRLAKRHGAVGLGDQLAHGATPATVLALLAHSAGLSSPPAQVADGMTAEIAAQEILETFDPERIRRGPWILDPASLTW